MIEFEICNKEYCTGCFACANICPKNCIEMVEDNYGFLRPKIDFNKCISCKSCINVCPVNKNLEKQDIMKAYAAWSSDNIDRQTSTSGGIASVFSRYIVCKGGIVYGASWENGVVRHIRVDNTTDLYKLKGSKYVSSNIGYIYKLVKKDLKEEKLVLFTGTPCQIAGLKSYLNKKYEKLYIVDIICHGTPSQKILLSHLNNKIGNTRFKDIKFREDNKYLLKVTDYQNRILYNKAFPFDGYTYGFSYNLFHRPSCYVCKYACNKRVSDITIGDFWGLGNFKYSKEKVSVILINNEKGKCLLENTSSNLFLEERMISEAVNGNAQLQKPSVKHKYYNLFHYIYIYFGFKIAIKICMLEFYIKYTISKFIRKI